MTDRDRTRSTYYWKLETFTPFYNIYTRVIPVTLHRRYSRLFKSNNVLRMMICVIHTCKIYVPSKIRSVLLSLPEIMPWRSWLPRRSSYAYRICAVIIEKVWKHQISFEVPSWISVGNCDYCRMSNEYQYAQVCAHKLSSLLADSFKASSL